MNTSENEDKGILYLEKNRELSIASITEHFDTYVSKARINELKTFPIDFVNFSFLPSSRDFEINDHLRRRSIQKNKPYIEDEEGQRDLFIDEFDRNRLKDYENTLAEYYRRKEIIVDERLYPSKNILTHELLHKLSHTSLKFDRDFHIGFAYINHKEPNVSFYADLNEGSTSLLELSTRFEKSLPISFFKELMNKNDTLIYYSKEVNALVNILNIFTETTGIESLPILAYLYFNTKFTSYGKVASFKNTIFCKEIMDNPETTLELIKQFDLLNISIDFSTLQHPLHRISKVKH